MKCLSFAQKTQALFIRLPVKSLGHLWVFCPGQNICDTNNYFTNFRNIVANFEKPSPLTPSFNVDVFSPSHNHPFSFILTSHNIQTSSCQDWLNRLVDPIMTSLRSLVCLTYLCCLSREEVESKNRRAKSMRSGWCKEQTWTYMFPNGEKWNIGKIVK